MEEKQNTFIYKKREKMGEIIRQKVTINLPA